MSTAANVNVVELVDQPGASSSHAQFASVSKSLPQFFGLTENPFLDNVNPDYFFRTEAHEDAYLKMKKCIEDNISMGLITAQSGTGKTLLTQILLHEMDQQHYSPTLVLCYPRISRSALLKELAAELEIEGLPRKATLHRLINAVQEKIFKLESENKKPVIIIDEAHFLGGDTLHLIRTLSNIETSRKKLVSILLFGEDSFLKKLDKPKYKAILSRMFIRAHLRPLVHGEVEQYVKFRCLMAGGGNHLFQGNVFKRIHQVTGGVPREINRLCHNALQLAFQKQISGIDLSIVDTVINAGY